MNYAIAGASKKGNGGNGFADLVWIINAETFIWEVKSLGQSPKASAEAF